MLNIHSKASKKCSMWVDTYASTYILIINYALMYNSLYTKDFLWDIFNEKISMKD